MNKCPRRPVTVKCEITMQHKTAQTKALKLLDTVKYILISGFFMSTGIGVYLLSAS